MGTTGLGDQRWKRVDGTLILPLMLLVLVVLQVVTLSDTYSYVRRISALTWTSFKKRLFASLVDLISE